MTVAAPSTSQRRSLSLPIARQSTTALASPRPKIRSNRRADAIPAPAHVPTGSPSFFPPNRLPTTGLRANPRAAFAILISP
jgi:hypothetical protein